MIKNLVKSKWTNKQIALNSFLSIPNSFTAEIMSEQGYDALTIDYQHGMIGFNDLLTMIQAIRHSGVTPISQSGGDGVDQLNSKAVVAELAQKPSIDIESVERIKSAIKRGEYPVNLDAVADELIRSYVEMKS